VPSLRGARSSFGGEKAVSGSPAAGENKQELSSQVEPTNLVPKGNYGYILSESRYFIGVFCRHPDAYTHIDILFGFFFFLLAFDKLTKLLTCVPSENPTKITDHIYIGSYVAAMNRDKLKKELDIVSIINCTEAPNAFPGHFEYLHLRLLDEPKQVPISIRPTMYAASEPVSKFSQDILGVLGSVFDFIDQTIKRGGKVQRHALQSAHTQRL
jgi:hypothetical protein